MARSVGISASGIRWYERVGVLPPAARQPNGYRRYSERDRSILRLVAALRGLGLPPLTAGHWARSIVAGEASAPELAAMLTSTRAALTERREELNRLDLELHDLETTIASTSAAKLAAPSAAPISVLFLCDSNAGRSQMGEALLASLGGSAFEVRSAGIHPAAVSPMAIAALREYGIDWDAAHSKTIEAAIAGHPVDYIVTLSDSARESCPGIPGPHNSLHWNLDDPGAVQGSQQDRLAAYRRTLTQLRQRLVPFIELALITHTTEPRIPK